MRSQIEIRPACRADHSQIWAILKPIFRAGETYAIEPTISEDAALAYWAAPQNHVFVASEGGDSILGTYYVKPNGRGFADHICNCGYAVAVNAQGKGVARAMLEQSLAQAKDLGFLAMQFNFVLESNARAITTWERAGFETIGRIPKAYRHPSAGLVDARIMHKDL
ncbi:MAG: N-acetyltransferase [Pseudomonadota bacterium]